MTTHIILVSIFILSSLLAIIFAIADDNTKFDFNSLKITFALIGVFSMLATIVQIMILYYSIILNG